MLIFGTLYRLKIIKNKASPADYTAGEHYTVNCGGCNMAPHVQRRSPVDGAHEKITVMVTTGESLTA